MPTPTKLRAGAGDRHAGVQRRRRRHTPNASTLSPLKWLMIGAAAVLLLGWIDATAAGEGPLPCLLGNGGRVED